MTTKELAKMNEASVLDAYKSLKDLQTFKGMMKMQKLYAIAAQSGVSHMTVSKALTKNNIEL